MGGTIAFVCFQSLLIEGVDYECYSTCLSLPAESGPYPVKVMGTPKSTGKLVVHGSYKKATPLPISIQRMHDDRN